MAVTMGAAIAAAIATGGTALALDPSRAAAPGSVNAPPPALPGIWRIDWSKSDPRPRVDGSWIAGSGPGRMPGSEGVEGATRRGRRQSSDGERPDRYTPAFAAQTIIIFQRGSHIEISEDGRAAQPVDLGAVAVNASALSRPSIQEGRWEDPNLILTRNVAGGGTMTQTFTLAPDGNVLELSARIQLRMDEAPLLIHRVYNKFRG
ncbi:MAG TPA: hypothetical protein VF363_12475 [Candidatus Eisenbacteria bacterium]